MVFAGQLMVALCFAELAANFPVAGSIYNWGEADGQRHGRLARRLDDAHGLDRDDRGRGRSRYQITLPQIWSEFQIYGDGERQVRLRGQRRDPRARS